MESREDDFKLMDQYVKFSAEVARISLLGIGAIGFVFAAKDSIFPKADGSIAAKSSVGVALIAFCISIALSLAHRYWAAEFMESQIRFDRLQARARETLENSDSLHVKIEKAIKHRKRASKLSIATIWSCPASLAIGIAFTGIAILLMVFNG